MRQPFLTTKKTGIFFLFLFFVWKKCSLILENELSIDTNIIPLVHLDYA